MTASAPSPTTVAPPRADDDGTATAAPSGLVVAGLSKDLGGRTEVTYRLALDVSIPMIGMIKRKGEKILIDTALKGLKQRVESLT